MSEAKENSVIATTALWDMHEFAGIRIRMRKSDGFLSATDMCKVNKKKIMF